jgi:hypothetical protein
MPVIMKGGNSGNREDALPDVTRPFESQPPQDTSGPSAGSNVQTTKATGNKELDASPPVPGTGHADDGAI